MVPRKVFSTAGAPYQGREFGPDEDGDGVAVVEPVAGLDGYTRVAKLHVGRRSESEGSVDSARGAEEVRDERRRRVFVRRLRFVVLFCRLPSFSTAIRSPIESASVWLWVT